MPLGDGFQGVRIPSACSCSRENHFPLSCSELDNWSCDKEYALVKHCPRGHELHKVSGSNNIMCKACKRDYCFICTNDLGQHKGCLKYVGDEQGRLNYYMERYQAHDSSQKLTEKLLEYGLAYVIRIGVKSLIASRQALKYSYVYAYLHHVDPAFESAQIKLETAAEDLNVAIEEGVLDLDEIDNLSRQVSKCYEDLLRWKAPVVGH
jgi:hypothetical protein